jgi:hypothetical protein
MKRKAHDRERLRATFEAVPELSQIVAVELIGRPDSNTSRTARSFNSNGTSLGLPSSEHLLPPGRRLIREPPRNPGSLQAGDSIAGRGIGGPSLIPYARRTTHQAAALRPATEALQPRTSRQLRRAAVVHTDNRLGQQKVNKRVPSNADQTRTDLAQRSRFSSSPESTRTGRYLLLIPRSQVRFLPGPSQKRC